MTVFYLRDLLMHYADQLRHGRFYVEANPFGSYSVKRREVVVHTDPSWANARKLADELNAAPAAPWSDPA